MIGFNFLRSLDRPYGMVMVGTQILQNKDRVVKPFPDQRRDFFSKLGYMICDYFTGSSSYICIYGICIIFNDMPGAGRTREFRADIYVRLKFADENYYLMSWFSVRTDNEFGENASETGWLETKLIEPVANEFALFGPAGPTQIFFNHQAMTAEIYAQIKKLIHKHLSSLKSDISEKIFKLKN